MPTYQYECPDCGSVTDHFCRIDDRPDTLSCVCGGIATRLMAAPMVLSASYPDGYKRPGWDLFREATALQREAAISKKDKKREIAGEIKKLGVRVGKTE